MHSSGYLVRAGDGPVVPPDAVPEQTSFVDPTVTIEGEVVVGRGVYVAPFAQLIASRESPISIGPNSNVQDHVLITAAYQSSPARTARLAAAGLDPSEGIVVGGRCILAHGCTVKGPARIGVMNGDSDLLTGDQAVILGFGSQVDGAILEGGSGVSILGRVGPGVRLRRGFFVLPGKNVLTQDEADDPELGKARLGIEADQAFNDGVLRVNQLLALTYTELCGHDPNTVSGISVNPGHASFNPDRNIPTFAGEPITQPGFRNRIIGAAHFADSLSHLGEVMGNQVSIRADEGGPFEFGTVVAMRSGVVAHALENSEILAGNGVSYGQGMLVHGGDRRTAEGDRVSTVIEDDVTLGSYSVVFRSLVGRGSRIGHKSAVIDTTLPAGSVVPARTVYLNEARYGRVEW